MTRRAGTLVRRGPNTFLLRVELGKDGSGKRIRHNRTFRGTKRDADRVLQKLLRDRDLGRLTDEGRQPLNDYLTRWLTVSAAPRLRPGTLHQYEGLLNKHIRPALGNLRLHQITAADIQGVHAGMLRAGLSPRTIRYAHAVVRSALQQAVRWGAIPANPCAGVDLPRDAPSTVTALSGPEAQAFLDATKESPHHALFALLLGTGLRPSEALALRWTDLDLAGDRLRVTRSVRRLRREWVFSEPKTAAGRRQVDLPAGLSLLIANQPRHYPLVFHNADGEPVDTHSLRRRHFRPALERAGLDPTTRLYDLRHTHATLLLLAGVHPKIVSARLGHASVSLTLDVYSHVLPGMQREGAAALDAMLFAPRETTGKGVN